VTRRFRRIVQIRRTAALALAVGALAAPAAVADPPAGHDLPAIDAGRPAAPVDLRSPDARDAARPAALVDLRSPDARDAGRSAPAPVSISQPAAAQSEGFDWLDAGIGAGGLALLLVAGTGAAMTVRTRRSPAHTA
jgi:hypothetical protein